MNWTQDEAIKTCTEIEKWCPQFGCHIALTGGNLYGSTKELAPFSTYEGRKDLDILFYRIRQWPGIEMGGLNRFLMNGMGWKIISTHGWLTKWEDKKGRKIDVMIPAISQGDDYEQT